MRDAQRKREREQQEAMQALNQGKFSISAMLAAARFAQAKTLDDLRGDLPADEVPEVTAPSGRKYGGFAICGLRPKHWPRRPAIFLVEGRYFDPIILCTILANCTTMAMESPLDPPGTFKAARSRLSKSKSAPASKSAPTIMSPLAPLKQSM